MSRNHEDIVNTNLQEQHKIFNLLAQYEPEDVKALREMLTRDPDAVNATMLYSGQVLSPLVLAITNRKYESASLLLEEGANPNLGRIHSIEWSALMYATVRGELELVKKLVEGGADLNAQDSNGFTSLHHAIGSFKLEVFEYLIKNGADYSIKTDSELAETPSDLILRLKDHINEAEWLQKLNEMQNVLGAAIDTAQDGNLTVLLTTPEVILDMIRTHLLMTDEDLELLQMYLDVQPLALKTLGPSGESALVLAFAQDRFTVARFLLDMGADPNLGRYPNGEQTALMFAVANNKADLVLALLEKGAHVDAQDKLGNTALHIAARHGLFSMVHLLLTHRAGHGHVDTEGYTPLNLAMSYGKYDCAQSLVSFGADPNCGLYTENYSTNLMLAVEQKQYKLVNCLLRKGADLMAQDINGRTVQAIAGASGDEKMISIIDKEIERRNTPARKPGRPVGSSTAKREATELPANASNTSKKVKANDEIPAGTDESLISAAKAGLIRTVRTHLNSGANINAKDASGNTALHYAAGFGHVKVVDLLLKCGADKRILNAQGKTAHDLASSVQSGCSNSSKEYSQYSDIKIKLSMNSTAAPWRPSDAQMKKIMSDMNAFSSKQSSVLKK